MELSLKTIIAKFMILLEKKEMKLFLVEFFGTDIKDISMV